VRRRAAIAVLTLLLGWLVAGVVTAGPASAHAALVSSSPADGARLQNSPGKVTLQFSEHVTIGPGYARVLAGDGTPVDTGKPAVSGDTVTIPLREKLSQGGYVVTYRIISADSHPVSGAYAFAVGNGPLLPPSSVTPTTGTDRAVSVLLPIARWLGYAGLALAVGVPVLLLVCWPAGWTSSRLRRLTGWGATSIVVGAVLQFLLQGPYSAGTGLGSTFDPALLRDTLGSEAGAALVVHAGLGLGLLGWLSAVWSRGAPPAAWEKATGALLGIGVAVSTAAVGHAAAGPWSTGALVSTTVHVSAMAVWLGGLVGLLSAVLRPGVPARELAVAMPRFSRLAFWAVCALVVTGIVQTVRELPTPQALVTTEYGAILTAKLVVVVIVLAAAGVSRVWVQQHLGAGGRRPDGRRRVTAQAFAAGGPDGESATTAAAVGVADATGAGGGLGRHVHADAAADLPMLRRSVLVEFALAIGILALTSVLVGESPTASASTAQPIDVVRTLQGSAGPSGKVEISLAPATSGVNSLHLFLVDASGEPFQPAGIQVSLTNQADKIGPLNVILQPAGPGHYIADALNIPGGGTWTLTVVVRVDEFTATTASTTFPVG
jgi:copper transport protein